MTSTTMPRSSFTSAWERRLLQLARDGDRTAETHLLMVYEPVVRAVTCRRYLPGAEREDLQQEVRVAVVAAIRTWDPSRDVPFSAYARVCASRAVSQAIIAARAAKHEVLNTAHTLGEALLNEARGTPGPDSHPVQKTLARERLQHAVERARELTELERAALELTANGLTHRECADRIGVDTRAVNNSLQRVRRKLMAGY